MKKKGIGKILAMAAVTCGLTVSGLVAPAQVAHAGDTTGGTGSGNATGSDTSKRQWRSVSYDGNPEKTWSRFVELANPGYYKGLLKYDVDDVIKHTGANLNICKTKSETIWYLWSPGKGAVDILWNNETHGSRWHGNGTIESPYKTYGSRGPAGDEISNFKSYDSKNGSKINKAPGYAIICSGDSTPAFPDITTTVTENGDDIVDKSDYTKSAPYSYVTSVTKQYAPSANTFLNAQSSAVVKTNFGKLVDKYMKNDSKVKPDDMKKAVEAAIEKDKTLSHGTLNLNANNKKGMAMGGVLNFSENMKSATAFASNKTTTKQSRTCTVVQTWNKTSKKYVEKSRKCGDWKKGAVTSETINKGTLGTQSQVGFWQMIAVHCNLDQFNALIASGNGITNVSSGDSSKAISAVAITKKYATQPSTLDFGDSRNTNSARKATGTQGFYDKECPFDCTPLATATGASVNNGATSNVNNGGTKVSGGKYGVTSGSKKVNNNFVELFRDNEPVKLTLDTWFPKSAGVVSYNGATPVTTTITRWTQGTPTVEANKGGQFVMKKGNTALFSGSSVAGVQKNWDATLFSNTNTTMLRGLARDFTVQANWASDPGKPQVLNVKWEYAPNVSSNFYTNAVGFGSAGNRATGTATTNATAIQGKCYANFGTNTGVNTQAAFQANTGTGTTNNLDTGNMFQGVGNGSDAQNIGTNLVVNFVRSISE